MIARTKSRVGMNKLMRVRVAGFLNLFNLPLPARIPSKCRNKRAHSKGAIRVLYTLLHWQCATDAGEGSRLITFESSSL